MVYSGLAVYRAYLSLSVLHIEIKTNVANAVGGTSP